MDEHNQGIFAHYYGNSFNFQKIPHPANCFLDTSPDIRMHPKQYSALHITTLIINKNSCRELIVSTLTCNKDNFTHMSAFANITKILKQFLKTQKSNPTQPHNKPAFSIFHVVPNFANILTTVKIVKKLIQAKKIFIFEC